ncbi:MAG: hypothetical protein K2Q22_09305, partial [Cytophagales bacterium]|nr:hypothetical protein [Cytophagales bacterium]
MKTHVLSRIIYWFFIASFTFIVSCAKKKDPAPTSSSIGLSDPNAVINSLIVSGGTKLTGSLPSASYSSYAPTIDLGGSSSYTSAAPSGSFTLPFQFSSNYIF